MCGLFCSLVLEKQTNLFSKEMHKNFEQLLPDMRQSAHAYLLKPVHEALKVSKLTSPLLLRLLSLLLPMKSKSIKARCFISELSDLFVAVVICNVYTAAEEGASPSQMFSLCLLQQQYRKLGTSEWLNQHLFEPLLDTITHEFQDVKGSTDSCHQVKKKKKKKQNTHTHKKCNCWFSVKQNLKQHSSIMKCVCVCDEARCEKKPSVVQQRLQELPAVWR